MVKWNAPPRPFPPPGDPLEGADPVRAGTQGWLTHVPAPRDNFINSRIEARQGLAPPHSACKHLANICLGRQPAGSVALGKSHTDTFKKNELVKSNAGSWR